MGFYAVTRRKTEDGGSGFEPALRASTKNLGAFGEQLGLSKDWAARAVKAVGNYGEVYERNVGSQSKLAIPRGLNALWTDGGIQYAPPMR
jgi:general L-amino acid transport system substrate-binding protein